MTGMYRWMVAALAPSLLLGASLGTATLAAAEGPGSGEVTAVSLAPAIPILQDVNGEQVESEWRVGLTLTWTP